MYLKTVIVTILFSIVFSGKALAQWVVFDPITEANTYDISKSTNMILQKDIEIAKTTSDILEKNTEILSNVKKTLEAVTGDRKKDAAVAKDAALGKGIYSTTNAVNSAEKVVSDVVDIILDGVKTNFETTAKKPSDSKITLEAQAMNSVDLNALIKGVKKAIDQRKQSYKTVEQEIGSTKDIKASIDQNSQMQVQNGLVLNELIGVNNSILSTSQDDSKRRVVNSFNSMKAMSYD